MGPSTGTIGQRGAASAGRASGERQKSPVVFLSGTFPVVQPMVSVNMVSANMVSANMVSANMVSMALMYEDTCGLQAQNH